MKNLIAQKSVACSFELIKPQCDLFENLLYSLGPIFDRFQNLAIQSIIVNVHCVSTFNLLKRNKKSNVF